MTTVSIFALITITAAIAGGSDDDKDRRSAEVHVHGEATLAAAMDDATLSVELQSALWNLVGFERKPETEAERAALEAAREALRSGRLFEIDRRGRCSLVAAEPGVPDPYRDNDHDHEDDEAHDDHDHGAYSDVVARWTFSCGRPAAVRTIAVSFAAPFERLEAVEIVFLGDGVQAAGRLTPEAPALRIAR